MLSLLSYVMVSMVSCAELQRAKSSRSFGACVDVDGQEFLARVDGQGPDVLVIVHLYEPSVQVISLFRIAFSNQFVTILLFL